MLSALALLRKARVIHCDLKPENVLLTSRHHLSMTAQEDFGGIHIKLIDFGSSCVDFRTIYSYIQSRFYRSPEVILGLPYDTSIDMWSLGCVLAELFLGLPLFPGQNVHNQLVRMIKVLGRPSERLMTQGQHVHRYFHVATDVHARATYKLKNEIEYALENEVFTAAAILDCLV